MAEKGDNSKSPAHEYMLDIQVIDVLLVNKVFLGILILHWLGLVVIQSNAMQ